MPAAAGSPAEPGSPPPFDIVFALYPDVTQLDFTGPLEVLSRLPGARCRLASVRGGTLAASGGLRIADVEQLAQVEACALLCVPGGPGCAAAMEDDAYLADVRRLAAQARYITAVCTGSLLLGAAGLLRGKRAACHWAWRDLLPAFGAIPDSRRIVWDGPVVTGGGVTAGIDMAIALLAEIQGDEFAQSVQLGIEYAPAPPFAAGTPETALPSIVAAVRSRLDRSRPGREAAVARAAERLLRSQDP